MTLTTSNQLQSILIISALSFLLLLTITSITFGMYFRNKMKRLERESKRYLDLGESGRTSWNSSSNETVERRKGMNNNINENDNVRYARVVDSSESGELPSDSSGNQSSDTKFSDYLYYRDPIPHQIEYDPYLPLPLSSEPSLRNSTSKLSNNSIDTKSSLPRIPRVLSKRRYSAVKEELSDGRPFSVRKKRESYGIGDENRESSRKEEERFSLVDLNKAREPFGDGIVISQPSLLHLPSAASYSKPLPLLIKKHEKSFSDSSLPYMQAPTLSQSQQNQSFTSNNTTSNSSLHPSISSNDHPLPPTPTITKIQFMRPSKSPHRIPLPLSPPATSDSNKTGIPPQISTSQVYDPVQFPLSSPALQQPHPFYRVSSGGSHLYKIDSKGSLLETEFLGIGKSGEVGEKKGLMMTNPDVNSLRSATSADSRPSTSFEMQRPGRFWS